MTPCRVGGNFAVLGRVEWTVNSVRIPCEIKNLCQLAEILINKQLVRQTPENSKTTGVEGVLVPAPHHFLSAFSRPSS